ncbi:MAG: sulfite exporter TauE/SafE family protein [Ruminococcaceae bacterium]|nr:sulfite exporter TauE/SafE family protein [Oscillospiraceae bacterium]
MAIGFGTAFLAAVICGTLAGMGLGGGSLLILWLTAFMNVDPAAARGINLLFFLPAALISTLSRIWKGNLPIKKVMPAVWAGILFAFLFSILGSYLPMELLKKLFGILLLITGLRELFYRPRKAK